MDASSSHGLMKSMVHYGKKRALIEAQNEIREKSRVIEQLNKMIAELRSNLEKIQNEGNC
ncbi:unnamed protein product [Eruca vesicaria subsp. sativa]|uniref:Uncharacterized protein n=1 Tax=Eruca vesicaria subsp. sativa TaxID=29727 RepID=A0ABC8J6Z8_ERUVS|nr:unnamed protein product [Eruca vesicaria subsp. sativa]